MARTKRESALVIFGYNHAETIGTAVFLLFGAAMFVSIFFNITPFAVLSALLMFSGGPVTSFLMDGPARRAS